MIYFELPKTNTPLSLQNIEVNGKCASNLSNAIDNGRAIAPIGQILIDIKNYPPPEFLMPGVKQVSFGFVFGPPKSGKTVYLETLLMHIAAGRKNFVGNPLKYSNQRCLFISLEEGAKFDRYRRNANQISGFTPEEIELINENYIVSNLGMPSHVVMESDWNVLETAITESNASVVVIDSLNRLTADSNAEEEIAKKITRRLIEIVKAYDLTLFVINHTTKSSNEAIQTGASMSGSRIYGSEADFMIAVNRISSNARYTKLVFSRYDRDDYDTVDQYEITDKQWVRFLRKVSEYSLFKPTDGRTDDSNSEKVWQEIQDSVSGQDTFQIQISSLYHLFEGEDKLMSKPTFYRALDKLEARGNLEKCKEEASKGIYRVKI